MKVTIDMDLTTEEWKEKRLGKYSNLKNSFFQSCFYPSRAFYPPYEEIIFTLTSEGKNSISFRNEGISSCNLSINPIINYQISWKLKNLSEYTTTNFRIQKQFVKIPSSLS